MKRIISAIRRLVNNPYQFLLLLFVEIKKLKPLPIKPVQKRINGVLFEFDCAYNPTIGDMYVGGYEVETVELMKRILREGDVFIDVGANIGYLSAIGAGFVGKAGQVHSFEPVPCYFSQLKKMAKMNPGYKIVVNQCALGEKRGIAPIKVSGLKDIGFNSMVPGLMENSSEVKEIFEVSVYRLEDYIKEKAIDKVSLIKIDVEGWEFPVLKGLSNWFKSTKHLPHIICEIKPGTYHLLGCTLTQLIEYMQTFNYKSYNLVNTRKEVCISRLKGSTNVLFVSTGKSEKVTKI